MKRPDGFRGKVSINQRRIARRAAIRRVIRAMAIVGLLCHLAISGCYEPTVAAPPSSSPQQTAWPAFEVASFAAVYEVHRRSHQVENWSVSLEWEEGALARSGAREDFYRLRTSLGPRPDAERSYLLDRDLRVVREDQNCAWQESGECKYALILWKTAGRLAPLGFGLPLVLGPSNDSLDYQYYGAHFAISFQAQVVGNRLSINATDSFVGAGYPDASLTGRFVYESPHAFPREFMLSDANGTYASGKLSSVGRGSPMPMPSVRWNEPAGPPLNHAYDYFPGEDSDDFKRGRPLRAAVDALVNQSSTAQTMVAQGGCVVRYRISPTNDTGPLGLGNRASYLINIQAPSGATRSWEVTESQDAPVTQAGYAVGPEESVEHPLQCGASAGIPKPRINTTGVFDWFYRERLNESAPGAFSYTWLPGFLEAGQPDRWQKMTILSIPSWSNGGIVQPYRFEV
jgi:hypothetical protein